MRKFRCFIGLHDWSNWSLVGTGKIVDDFNDMIGMYYRQVRTCKCCNLTKFKSKSVNCG